MPELAAEGGDRSRGAAPPKGLDLGRAGRTDGDHVRPFPAAVFMPPCSLALSKRGGIPTFPTLDAFDRFFSSALRLRALGLNGGRQDTRRSTGAALSTKNGMIIAVIDP